MNRSYCTTCGSINWPGRSKCNTCREVEDHLEDYMRSPKGQDFVQKCMPTLNNWPDWDHEAVLSKHAITVEQDGEYWWSMNWRHGNMGFNVDDEVIARQCSALFAELFLRNFAASFADNVAHGYAMWLELQDQRYSFELTEELGDAILHMDGRAEVADAVKEAWNKLVETARVLKESNL